MTLKSAEWAQYSGALGKQYGAFQLGWFPDYPDGDNYMVPFYQPNNFTSNDYNSPKMNALIAKEHGASTTPARLATAQGGADARGEGRPDHPVLAGRDDRRRRRAT